MIAVSKTQSSALAEGAVWIATMGFAVFPLQPCQKTPYSGSRGCLDATTDSEKVSWWWCRKPASNVGVATGAASRLLVVDLDGIEATEAWSALTAGRENPETITVHTLRPGGLHRWYSTGLDIPNTTAKVAPKIDTRGHHGYVLAPPSVGPSGSVYRWGRGDLIADLPEWLREMIAPPPPPPKARSRPRLADGEITDIGSRRWLGVLTELEATNPGRRHAMLYWASRQGGAFIDAGLISTTVVEGSLLCAADALGLIEEDGEKNVLATIRQGVRKGGGL